MHQMCQNKKIPYVLVNIIITVIIYYLSSSNIFLFLFSIFGKMLRHRKIIAQGHHAHLKQSVEGQLFHIQRHKEKYRDQ